MPGTAIGLLCAILWPWPWPYTPAEAMQSVPANQPWWWLGVNPKSGLYPWPVWGPLPDWMEPGGNWQTGLATGVAGLLAGTLVLRGVGFIFARGLGKEALGLGDAMLPSGAPDTPAAPESSTEPGSTYALDDLEPRGGNGSENERESVKQEVEALPGIESTD